MISNHIYIYFSIKAPLKYGIFCSIQVLKEGKVGEDLTEVARLFNVHNQKKS